MFDTFQTRFNEAVNKVCKEKDRVIEELQIKERELIDILETHKGMVMCLVYRTFSTIRFKGRVDKKNT